MVQHSFNVDLSTTDAPTNFVATRQTHKFGGSSLADVGCFLRVANIIREHCGPTDLFVVSAAGKTTDKLVRFADQCGHDPFLARVELVALFEYQLELINGLLLGSPHSSVAKTLRREVTELRRHADEVVDAEQRANILAHGEVWSARLLSALLNQFGLLSEWLDARDVLRAELGIQPQIDHSLSKPLVQHAIEKLPGQRIVVTGFMASNQDGKTVLLGRNGSDYSATMVGILAGSQCVTIWSDVSGVYSADPRKVGTAQLLSSISLIEANELANLGAPVLHRRSLQPVIEHDIQVALRSSYDPHGGTTSIQRAITTVGAKVTTSVDSIAVLSVSSPAGESCDRIASFGTAALDAVQLQPVATNATSSHGIVQFVFFEEHVADAIVCLESAGFTVHRIEDKHALVGIVGAGVAHSPVDREKFFGAIGKCQESNTPPALVVSSDLSLAVVLKSADIDTVLNNVHAALIGNA